MYAHFLLKYLKIQEQVVSSDAHTTHYALKNARSVFFTSFCSLFYDDHRRRAIVVAAIAASLLVRGCQKNREGN